MTDGPDVDADVEVDVEAVPATAPPLPPWRTGRISFPALVTVLVVVGAAGLGAASVGGWGGVALLVILVAACLATITSWAVTR
jgi:hypothetical protein